SSPELPVFPGRDVAVADAVPTAGRWLARTAAVDMAAFFAVLLVGFAYVWYRGDLDWVRAVAAPTGAERSGGGGVA
ncbi:MAG: NADH-quinone oxidoreductase subunit A, partial [Planctomycetia bacterium]